MVKNRVDLRNEVFVSFQIVTLYHIFYELIVKSFFNPIFAEQINCKSIKEILLDIKSEVFINSHNVTNFKILFKLSKISIISNVNYEESCLFLSRNSNMSVHH